jgi:hypothetical protein
MKRTQLVASWPDAARTLVRDANEQIDRLTSSLLADQIVQPAYVCECADLSCRALIQIPRGLYRQIRRDATQFIVSPGHELPGVEEIVERESRWLVVRNRALARGEADSGIHGTASALDLPDERVQP